MGKLKRRAVEAPSVRDRRIIAATHLWLAPNPTIRVREMAKATGLSPARFTSLFVLATGMIPGEFLQTLKKYQTERARALTVLRSAGADRSMESR